jgi:hypothetical protein
LTLGKDNTSDETPERLVPKLARAALIYCIGLLKEENSRDKRHTQRALKGLAGASGGLDHYPQNLADVERVTPGSCTRKDPIHTGPRFAIVGPDWAHIGRPGNHARPLALCKI